MNINLILILIIILIVIYVFKKKIDLFESSNLNNMNQVYIMDLASEKLLYFHNNNLTFQNIGTKFTIGPNKYLMVDNKYIIFDQDNINYKLVNEFSESNKNLSLFNVGSYNDNVSFYIVSNSNDTCNFKRNSMVSPDVNDYKIASNYYYINNGNTLIASCNVFKASQYSLLFV